VRLSTSGRSSSFATNRSTTRVNAKKGLGRMMTDAREYFQIDVVFVLIAVYAILGLVSILVVRFLESRLLTWRRAYDGD
jgi:sulfonate transport system permease protein